MFRVICSTAGRGKSRGEDRRCRKDGFPGRDSWEVAALGHPFLLCTIGVRLSGLNTAAVHLVFWSRANIFLIFAILRGKFKQNFHPKTLFEIAMVLSTNSGSFPSNSHVSATFSILLRFGESWNPTNFERFNADGSLMGKTNLDKSVW